MDLDSYIECSIWASSCEERVDESGHPISFDMLDECAGLSDSAKAIMQSELSNFHARAEEIIDSKDWQEMGIELPSDSEIAHDFWLTRNGHGAGFWDRGMGELGDRLTELAESHGGRHLWLNEDTLEIEIN